MKSLALHSGQCGPTEGHFDWDIAFELLEGRQYEQAAEYLHTARTETEQNDNTFLIDILVAAHRICQACDRCRAEQAWHHRAFEEANRREQELREQLYAILNSIIAYDLQEQKASRVQAPSVPTINLTQLEDDLPESEAHPGFLQQFQNWLGWTLRPRQEERETEGEADEILSAAQVSASTPAEKTETLVLSPAEQAKSSPPPPADKTEGLAPLPDRETKVLSVSSTETQEPGLDPPSLVVYCLGPFRVYQDDQLIVEWKSLKGQSLLKYLIMHKGKPIAKDILMEVFWPDVDPGDTRRNLHQAIYSLRQTLRRRQPDLQPILFKKECYLLNSEIAIWLDFEEFEKHVQTGRQLEGAGRLAEAVAEYSIAEGLYQGDFLEEDLYEDWPSLQRDHLRSLHLDIADRLSEYYVQQGEYTAAIALCQKVLAQDNCYEQAHRRLVHCYLGQGQRHLAVRQYQTCVEALREELDLTPSEETVALYRRIITTA